MAKTFREFIAECEMYPHSKEHYQIQKECAELSLLEQYISDQIYVQENATMLEAAGLEDGYMQESVDSSTMDGLLEAYTEKVGNVLGKIKKGFLKLVTAFWNFIKKHIPLCDGLNNRAKAVLKKLNSMKAGPERNDLCAEVVRKAKAAKGSNFPIRADQPFMSKLKGEFTDGLKNDLAAALSTDVVVAKAESGSSAMGAVDFKSFQKACGALCKGKDGYTVKGAHNALTGAWATSQKNGVKINVNTEALKQHQEALGDLLEKVKQMEAGHEETYKKQKGEIEGEIERRKANGQDDIAVGEAANSVEAEHKLYTDLTACCSATMSLLSTLNGYRSAVIAGLEGALGAASGGEE